MAGTHAEPKVQLGWCWDGRVWDGRVGRGGLLMSSPQHEHLCKNMLCTHWIGRGKGGGRREGRGAKPGVHEVRADLGGTVSFYFALPTPCPNSTLLGFLTLALFGLLYQ